MARSTFAWPLLIGAASVAGLVLALLGEGAADVAGWLLLGVPIIAVLATSARDRVRGGAVAGSRRRPFVPPQSRSETGPHPSARCLLLRMERDHDETAA